MSHAIASLSPPSCLGRGIFEIQISGVDNLQFLNRRVDNRAIADGVDDARDSIGAPVDLCFGGVGERRKAVNYRLSLQGFSRLFLDRSPHLWQYLSNLTKQTF